MTPEEVPEPPASYKAAVLQAGGVLVRTQPLLLGFIVITLFVLYVTWQLAAEIRKTDRLQTQLLLERCLPKGDP